jgi:DNA mismatch repair protein MutL
MGRVRLLSDAVASQVAAGEVVERPASVLKELVENSLDAGATRVDIEYHRGGDKFLSVTDDGCGMDREDALLCLERHATSKIRTGRDLATVATFGFRGEALPSIASVSRFRLVTRERDAEAGTEVIVNGGKVEDVRDSGEAPGTRIEIRSLFFNLPARRKFLRGERTEAAHIDHQFQILALAHAERRFSLTRDGRQVHLLAPAADLAARVRDLCGAEFSGQLCALEERTHNGIKLRGLIGRPGHGRGDRSQQFVFVNGRAVQSPAISQPLREAYGTAMPRGMNPPAVLFVTLDPEWVDCNVHPAKREVRFRDAISVREAVQVAVSGALADLRRVSVAMPTRVFAEPESVDVAPPPKPDSASVARTQSSGESFNSPGQRNHSPEERVQSAEERDHSALPSLQRLAEFSPRPRELHEAELPGIQATERKTPEPFRFIGGLGERYVLLEDDAGLVLLDNRAARERILFEQLLRRIERHESVSQRLLLPAIVELAPRDFAWICEHAGLLAGAGISVEPFGSGAVKVDGVPPMLVHSEPRDVLLRVADDCRAGTKGGNRAIEEAIARSVCRSASLGSVPLDAESARALLDELMACELPYTCPAGRPTMIHFAHTELERKFGRGR